MLKSMTTIALGMEVVTHRGDKGQVVGSPRNGRGWLVCLDLPRPVDRRFHEENLMEWHSSMDDPHSDYNRM